MDPTTNRTSLTLFVLALAAAGMLSCSHGRLGLMDPGKKAQRMLTEGDTTGALEFLETLDIERHDDPELFIALGSLYREEGTITGRLESQYLLERANQLHPHHPRVLLELGKTYYAQTFFPDAERCFKEALELDGSLCGAKYYIGLYYFDKWRRMNEYHDDLGTARSYFKSTLACDSMNVAAARKYAYSLYVLERREELAAACDTYAARFPEQAEFRFVRGTLAYDGADYAKAMEEFVAALALLDEDERALFAEIGSVLTLYDRDEYDAEPVDEREVMERVYWLNSDPDPTTAVNERHIEHIYRVFLSDVYFSVSRPERRGWDTERGETFIKFGWPLTIEYTLGSSYKDGRSEFWNYVIDGNFHQFRFVDEYLNGNLRIPYRSDLKLAYIRHTSKRTDYFPDFVDVPGAMDVVTFKDDEFNSSIYISFIVDADSFASVADFGDVDHVYVRSAFFDGNWLPEQRIADTLWTTDVPRSYRHRRRVYDLVRTVRMPFDQYHVAVAFEDEHARASAQFKGEGDTSRYAGDGLSASDILLQRNTTEGAVINRNGSTLLPNTVRRYLHGERLRLYFEVYNLNVIGNRNSYTIGYAIYPTRDEHPSVWATLGRRLGGLLGRSGDPSISQTLRRAGASHREGEEMSINIDSLDEGLYDLVVKIADELTGAETETRTTFLKLDAIGQAQ